jgi:hypothetical protein
METTRAMTYDEIAAALRISPDSARRLVRRRRWAKIRGNDGFARVNVPIERLEAAARASEDDPEAARDDDITDNPEDDPPGADHDAGTGMLVAFLQARVTELATELGDARQKIDDFQDRARRAEVRAAVAEAHLIERDQRIAATDAMLGEIRARMQSIQEERDRWYGVATARRGWWPWRRAG